MDFWQQMCRRNKLADQTKALEDDCRSQLYSKSVIGVGERVFRFSSRVLFSPATYHYRYHKYKDFCTWRKNNANN